jgi:hypothetical protein
MSRRFGKIVRMKGLEPPRRETPDPKSGAATNYATSAVLITMNEWICKSDGKCSINFHTAQ